MKSSVLFHHRSRVAGGLLAETCSSEAERWTGAKNNSNFAHVALTKCPNKNINILFIYIKQKYTTRGGFKKNVRGVILKFLLI